MNNKEQKNVIYGINPKNMLPYELAQDVQTKAGGFKSNTLNNIFQQLVDNDRYIENRLAVGGRNIDGPGVYSDDQLASLDNGTKILSSSASTEQIVILRKEEQDLQDTLKTVFRSKVNVMCRFGSYLLVGTDVGLFQTQDGENFQALLGLDGDQLNGTMTGIRAYAGVVLFGMDGNLYCMTGQRTARRVNANSIGTAVNDVLYLPYTKTMYVASDRGMFKAEVANIQNIDDDGLVFSQVTQIDGDGLMDSFENFSVDAFGDGKTSTARDLVAATNAGVMVFREVDGLVNLSKVLDDQVCYFVDRIDDALVVGTPQGIMDGLGRLVIKTSQPVAAFHAEGSKRYYFTNSTLIEADFTADARGAVEVQTTEIPFPDALEDYAVGMYSLQLTNDSGVHEPLILIHTRGGLLLTYLPSTQMFVVVARGDFQASNIDNNQKLYTSGIVNGQMAVESRQFSNIRMDYSDVVSSLEWVEPHSPYGLQLSLGEVLKTIPDEDGAAVVLTKAAAWAISSDWTGAVMCDSPLSDYAEIVKLRTPIQYQYGPLLSDFLPQYPSAQQIRRWSEISDDVYTLDYKYAALRGGRDGAFFVDLVAGPELGLGPGQNQYSVFTLSGTMNGNFQYPIDIKQDEDTILVLASDGLHYTGNDVVDSFLNSSEDSFKLSGEIVGKRYTVDQTGYFQTYSVRNFDSANRIARNGDNLYLLSSGNLLDAEMQPWYMQTQFKLPVGVEKVFGVPELSQMYVVATSESNRQICCISLVRNGDDFSFENDLVDNSVIPSNYGYYQFRHQEDDETLSVYCDLVPPEQEGENGFNMLCINCSSKTAERVKDGDVSRSDQLDGVLIQSVSSYEDPDTQEISDFVSSAVKYTVKSSPSNNVLTCLVTSALYIGELTSYQYETPYFQFTTADESCVASTTSEITAGVGGGVSSLDSFSFPDGIVRCDGDGERNMYAVSFLLSDGSECAVQKVQGFENDYLELFKENVAVVSSLVGRSMYGVAFDERELHVNFLQDMVVSRNAGTATDRQISGFMHMDGFDAVTLSTLVEGENEEEAEVSVKTMNMFDEFFGTSLSDALAFVDSYGNFIVDGGRRFVTRRTGLSGIDGMIDDEGMVFLLSSTQDDTSAAVYHFVDERVPLEICAQYDAVPSDFFRDRSGIYAVIGDTLYRRGSNGLDYAILSTGSHTDRINHVQTAIDSTLVATEDGLVAPRFIRQQSMDVEYSFVAPLVQMSSASQIVLRPNRLSVVAEAYDEDGDKRILGYDAQSMSFNRTQLGGFDRFQGVVEVKDADNFLFSVPGGQTSAFRDGEVVPYPFGGSPLSILGSQKADGRTYVCTRDGVIYSDGFGTQNALSAIDGQESLSAFGRLLRVQDDVLLAPTNDGLYTVTRNDGVPAIQKTTYSLEGDVRCIVKTADGYAVGAGGAILSAGTGMQFTRFLEPRSRVNDIYYRNAREYYIGTDSGLFRTSYGFRLVNDTYVFSEDEIYDIFMDYMQTIKDELAADLSDHVQTHHADNAIVSKVNNELVGVDFDGADLREWSQQGFSGLSAEHTVDNDVVYDMEFGSNVNGDIHVQISNFLTSDSNPKFSYIRKHWYSGVNELYIYLPTTNTYYISHVDGSPGCQVTEDEVFTRKNLTQFGEAATIKSTIPDHATMISVLVPDTVAYRMDELLDVQINGNSLPLKIYRDDEFAYKEGDAAGMFHSVVLPSEVVCIPTGANDRDENGQYRFCFACFGQDAQAIRIMYYDADSHVDENSYTVKFNANGALGSMQDQVFRLDGSHTKRLRKCSFYWNQGTARLFAGWSFTPNASQVDIMDGDVLDWERYAGDIPPPVAGATVNLYAVWIAYSNTDGWTEVIMDFGDEQ